MHFQVSTSYCNYKIELTLLRHNSTYIPSSLTIYKQYNTYYIFLSYRSFIMLINFHFNAFLNNKKSSFKTENKYYGYAYNTIFKNQGIGCYNNLLLYFP